MYCLSCRWYECLLMICTVMSMVLHQKSVGKAASLVWQRHVEQNPNTDWQCGCRRTMGRETFWIATNAQEDNTWNMSTQITIDFINAVRSFCQAVVLLHNQQAQVCCPQTKWTNCQLSQERLFETVGNFFLLLFVGSEQQEETFWRQRCTTPDL